MSMPLPCFPKEFQCGPSIPALGNEGDHYFTFVINGLLEVMGDAVDLHETLIEVAAPLGQGLRSLPRLPRTSATNISPNLFRQNRTVSWQMPIPPPSCSRTSTLRGDRGADHT